MRLMIHLTNGSTILSVEETFDTRNTGGKRRSWDDEYILKRQFSALIPAFDPRPGRTNVNQTTDLEIPAPGLASEATTSTETCLTTQPKLQLILRGPNLPGIVNVFLREKNIRTDISKFKIDS
ncbi:hect E3 ubiquitin ligase, putative [Pediculus humanus corporis]|uniref:Hect E3 ubiquitin ligase, putative n=1 Tax=Pediculus humanus subsp. corporis TaxID=121224 RepID=E0VS81_PEDHC|nr:hect E3 ubiquitin ligase, putative [Pediculus humanus corporis]EEB16237.1 hect E3 ubiquitin ligase, putative [Pediculus humanus corporis]